MELRNKSDSPTRDTRRKSPRGTPVRQTARSPRSQGKRKRSCSPRKGKSQIASSQITDKCGACSRHLKEDTLQCAKCKKSYHPTCLKLGEKLLDTCRGYNWYCGRCKRCEICGKAEEEAKVLLCDFCDRGYHTYCLQPPLDAKPKGTWHCEKCSSSHSSTPAFPLPTGRRKIFRYPLPTPSPRISTPDRCSLSGGTDGRGSSCAVLPVRKLSAEISPVSEQIPDTCPTDGCTGDGHLSGKYSRHTSKEACPLYHNLSAEEAKDQSRLRSKVKKEEPEQRSSKHASPTRAQLESIEAWMEERRQVNSDLISRRALRAELQKKHRDQHGKSREPLLDGLSTDKDLALFRHAQSLLSVDMEENPNLGNRKDTQVRSIQFGNKIIDTWYASPFPDGMDKFRRLYFCEFCLKYMATATILQSHIAKCIWYHPPGDEIYRLGEVSFWEVDGRQAKEYCQNLCLLAKLFLDHKTLYFDVEPFLFYVMTEADKEGCHMVGYFSKEKKSVMNCNVSCILTLPQHQRKGVGRSLIEFSYLLTRAENKVGSPERPLSDMGLLAYRSYWTDVILEEVSPAKDTQVSIRDLSQKTGIHPNDIVSTLQLHGMVKYWRGEYWIYKRKDMMHEFEQKKKERRSSRKIRQKYLVWTPPEEME